MLESQASEVISLTVFSKVNNSPRRVLQSQYGKVDVLINLVVGSPSFVRAVGQISKTFTAS